MLQPLYYYIAQVLTMCLPCALPSRCTAMGSMTEMSGLCYLRKPRLMQKLSLNVILVLKLLLV